MGARTCIEDRGQTRKQTRLLRSAYIKDLLLDLVQNVEGGYAGKRREEREGGRLDNQAIDR